MTTDHSLSAAALLRLMRLASPSLPVGGFSYSEGLESAVEAGRVSGEASARAWLVDQLWLALARSDLPVVAAAIEAWRSDDADALAALNAWVASTRETSELARQSEQTGRALAAWLRHAGTPAPQLATLEALPPAPSWPLAFALAAAAVDAPAPASLLAFATAWAENMVQAAMKSIPLGQAAGQRVLDAVASEIPAAVEAAARCTPGERQAFVPMLAILSSQHEAQYSRLFRS